MWDKPYNLQEGATGKEQRRLDIEAAARDELERLRRGDADKSSYSGSRDEMTTPLVTLEPAERKALDADAALQLISMTFRSRSSNPQPHIVTLRPSDGVTSCTCESHALCWAQKAFRQVRGMQ